MAKIRSEILQGIDWESERGRVFSRDLKKVLTLNHRLFPELVDAVVSYIEAKIEKDERQAIDGFMALCEDASRLDIVSIFNITHFLLKQLSESASDKGTLESIVSDLANVIDDFYPENMRSLLEAIVQKIDIYKSFAKRWSYESGVVPALTAVANTVEIRPMLDKRFVFGDDVMEYSPTFTDFISSVSISLGLDDDQTLVFQVSPDSLNLLISSLLAAQFELEALESTLTVLRSEVANST